jgi:HEPN domain-containing protein
MNRADFKRLAQVRVRETKALLAARSYAGAYYLAGYAVECALKACIARQTKRYDFPPDQGEIKNIYTHDLTRLLKSAGLNNDHENELNRNQQFKDYWLTVKDWSEQSRYIPLQARQKAQDLYEAITDPRNGVLQWLKKYW